MGGLILWRGGTEEGGYAEISYEGKGAEGQGFLVYLHFAAKDDVGKHGQKAKYNGEYDAANEHREPGMEEVGFKHASWEEMC